MNLRRLFLILLETARRLNIPIYEQTPFQAEEKQNDFLWKVLSLGLNSITSQDKPHFSGSYTGSFCHDPYFMTLCVGLNLDELVNISAPVLPHHNRPIDNVITAEEVWISLDLLFILPSLRNKTWRYLNPQESPLTQREILPWIHASRRLLIVFVTLLLWVTEKCPHTLCL